MLLGFSACSDEPGDEPIGGDSTMRFAPTLSDIAWSRAADITEENLSTFQNTCFNPAKAKDGALEPYFFNVTFGKIGSVYVSAEDSCYYPEQFEPLDFIAFAPSRADMAKITGQPLGENDTRFAIVNKSTVSQGKATYDFSIVNMPISRDISHQYDFITATASGSKFSTINDPVTLNFTHALSKIEIRAWGKSPVYRIEIAGVRLGIVPLEGSYNLTPGQSTAERWTVADNVRCDKVEYIYPTGEQVVVIDKYAADPYAEDKPALIMRGSSSAMLIPYSHAAWDYTKGKNTTGGGYLSVLMRVSNIKDDTMVAYPYADDNDSEKIWLTLDDKGSVTGRVYRNVKGDGKYYTDPDFTKAYTLPANEKIREYGWAAIPVEIDWKEGQHYVYTLDYTLGLGLKDPDDSDPGKVILKDPQVGMIVTVNPWISGGNTNETVPRK